MTAAGVADPAEQQGLARSLHLRGRIVHHADVADLTDTVVRDPQWLFHPDRRGPGQPGGAGSPGHPDHRRCDGRLARSGPSRARRPAGDARYVRRLLPGGRLQGRHHRRRRLVAAAVAGPRGRLGVRRPARRRRDPGLLPAPGDAAGHPGWFSLHDVRHQPDLADRRPAPAPRRRARRPAPHRRRRAGNRAGRPRPTARPDSSPCSTTASASPSTATRAWGSGASCPAARTDPAPPASATPISSTG